MFIKKPFLNATAAKLALAALVVTVASPAAMAAVVCNSLTTPFTIPANIDGAYINLVTGASGTAGSGVAGWDVNMYLTADGLYFFWPTAPANSYGGVATGTVYNYLADGSPIGAAQTFSVASGGGGPTNYVNFRATVSGGNLGVRFFNEATSAINYGWVELSLTAPTGFPATITGFCYDNTGAAINAGTTPVALQKFSVD